MPELEPHATYIVPGTEKSSAMLHRLELLPSSALCLPVLTSSHVAPQSVDLFMSRSFATQSVDALKGSMAIDLVSISVLGV
jgi:hypothetical protein